MRNSIKKLSHALLPLGVMATMMACSDDDMPKHGFTRAEIQATATSNAGANPIVIGDFTVEHFSAGVQNVEMMFLHHDAVAAGVTLENGTLKPNTDSPLARSGVATKQLILTNAGEIQSSPVGTGETPSGIYNEITFNLTKITNDTYGPTGKSIVLAGKVDEKPVLIWLESEDAISVPAKSSTGYEVSGQASFVIEFNLDKILANVNFDNATDFNNNGTVEIGPNNIDANGSIYNAIRNNITASLQFQKQ
jgi:hypothetical protein